MKLEPLPNRPDLNALNALIEANNANADRITALEDAMRTSIAPQADPQPNPPA